MPGYANKQEATALSAVNIFEAGSIVSLLSVSQASAKRRGATFDLEMSSRTKVSKMH